MSNFDSFDYNTIRKEVFNKTNENDQSFYCSGEELYNLANVISTVEQHFIKNLNTLYPISKNQQYRIIDMCNGFIKIEKVNEERIS